MSIKVQNLLAEKARRFGASASSADFQQIFLDAINYALNDIDEALGITTDEVTGTSGTIDLDSQQYKLLIAYGIDVYMADMGAWSVSPDGDLRAKWREKLTTRLVNYLKEQDVKGGLGDVDEDLS